MDYNKVLLLGRLGADVEMRSTPGGSSVCQFNLATNRRWTDAAGEHEQTHWHRCTAWGKAAETIAKYGKKGRRLLVDGRIEYRKYTDKEGAERYSTDIVIEAFSFTDKLPVSNGKVMPEVDLPV